MTEGKRIALNVIATYGRSIYSLVCGLFTARWVLMALGEVDYGLYGVVGGMTLMITFINNLMATAVSRFYAFQVGAARNSGASGVEECRKWFNTALLIHTVIPILLVAVGYPVGSWAIDSYLTIPPDRVEACHWVWIFVCIGCFSSMVNIPFYAMYTAKQEIAELTIYSFAQTTLNVVALYYMVSHPDVWLVKYALWSVLILLVPQQVVILRALVKYPECRFRVAYLWSSDRIMQILGFAGGRFLSAIAQTVSTMGTQVLVNKVLGPARNAAMSVGNGIASHCNTLSAAMMGAFNPAITNAAGEKDYEKMRRYMYATCSLCEVTTAVLALPLMLEVKEVMILWLKNPPEWSIVLCFCMLATNLVEMMCAGLWIGVFAIGRIAVFQAWEALIIVFVVPLAYVFARSGLDILGVGVAVFISRILNTMVKLYYARKECGISARVWIAKVAVPSVIVGVVSVLPGCLVLWFMEPSFKRVILTTFVVEGLFIPLSWKFLLPPDVKNVLSRRIPFLNRYVH